MKRILLISTGIIGVLAGLAFVMPALAQYRHTGAMSDQEVGLCLLGMVLTIGGMGLALVGARRRSA